MALLVANAGQPVTYRAIYDQVHYAGFVAGDGERGFERNVRTMIKRMRRKFEAIDPGFQAIRSIVGLGYSWTHHNDRDLRAAGPSDHKALFEASNTLP